MYNSSLLLSKRNVRIKLSFLSNYMHASRSYKILVINLRLYIGSLSNAKRNSSFAVKAVLLFYYLCTIPFQISWDEEFKKIVHLPKKQIYKYIKKSSTQIIPAASLKS